MQEVKGYHGTFFKSKIRGALEIAIVDSLVVPKNNEKKVIERVFEKLHW